jgi:hypothetical protein
MEVDAAGGKNRKPVRIQTSFVSKPGELTSACKRTHLQFGNFV